MKLKIPIPQVHEHLFYEVYEGDKVVNRGDAQGHSFTTLGKNRIAAMVAGDDPSTYKLDTYRVLVDASTWFSSVDTVLSRDEAAGYITAETQEFVSAGQYKRIQGWSVSDTPNVDSYYHYVTTSVTIGAGQTVKFFIEYTFDGLGSEGSGGYPKVQGDVVCGALLLNYVPNNYAYMIGAIELVLWDGSKESSFPLSISQTDNQVLISGSQFELATGCSTHYIRALTSTAGAKHVFHEWSYLDSDGDASGPFTINNDLSPSDDITLQTDMLFTFDP